MGLAPSTRRVPSTDPTMFIFWEGLTLTPAPRPIDNAKFDVSVAVNSTPPFATNACSRATPSQPRPGRMSSVESLFPTRFGVSDVFFQGNGFPQAIGNPLIIAVEGALNPTGGNKITSYFAFRSSILATACVLM